MQRNLRLYPVYRGLRGLIFWLPVFFLYFASVLGPGQVLLLEAIYYLTVVVAEVPSGYFSDRVGRRLTLLIAAGAWTSACCVFVLTGTFLPFVVAQIGLAVGMAFNSGTDSALLYDSLKALGREDEIAQHEARAQAWALGAMAIAAVAGGLMAGLDLRFAYLLSALSASLAFAAAWHFVEPARTRALPPARQLIEVTRRLRDPTLRWVFLFVVAMTVFSHVPYEMFQPWLELLLARLDRPGYAVTPAAAGLLLGVSGGLAAWASRHSPTVGVRLGVKKGLLLALGLQAAVMAGMAAAVHPAIIVLLLLRSMGSALVAPIALSVIHPRVESGQRATYLSMQSLAGRLAFSATLFAASAAVGGVEHLDHPVMRGVLLAYLAAALATGLLLARAGGPEEALPDR